MPSRLMSGSTSNMTYYAASGLGHNWYVNGNLTVGSPNMSLASTGAVTIPGTLGVTGIITASSDIGLAYGKTVYWNSTSNQYVVADANGLYLGAGNLARISIAQATGVVTIPSVAATFRESLVLNGSTTAGNYVTLSNTGANLRIGIDNSAGNALITGGTAYGSVVGSNNATTLHLITNGISRVAINSSGAVTIPGQLSFVTSAASPSTTIGNTGNGDTGFLLTMLATNALKNWQHSFNNYSAGYSIHYSTVNGGSTFNSSNVAINFGETGAVTIPGTLTSGVLTSLGVAGGATGTYWQVTPGLANVDVVMKWGYISGSAVNFNINNNAGTTVLKLSDGGAVTIPGTLDIGGAVQYGSSVFAALSAGTICGQFANTASGHQTLSIWNKGTTGDNSFISFATEAVINNRGSISYNRAGGLVAYNTSSDYRAKDITGKYETSGETIDQLQVYLGKMKEATIERPMMIAHEAASVVPYAVTGEKDAVDENGDPIYQSMDHQIFVPLLIAEIQSLRSRIATLEAR